MTFSKFAATALALAIATSAGSAAFAKAHDQGAGEQQGGPFEPSDAPATPADTAAAAQGLGDALGGTQPGRGISQAARENNGPQ
ncbi:hypothetical protein HKCCE3408_01190 [Rhodobacterales bacterium HKCCE3408]|nr:hypothetical protein [Rhodobacterales bacterium HKCCE3408]